MKPALVIGYGNPLRSDDGLGWAVADRLAARFSPETTGVMTVHQLMPEMAEQVSGAGVVYFVDAAAAGRAGTWNCAKIETAGANDGNALGHHFEPAGLLAYAGAVFGGTPEAYLVSVAGGSFKCSETLSQEVESVLPEVADFISGEIQKYQQGTTHHAIEHPIVVELPEIMAEGGQ